MCDLIYTKEWNDVNMYQGFVNPLTGLYEGNGRIKFLNPNSPTQVYLGSFTQGKLTGSGTIWYSDGTIYKGQVVDGKRNGMGSLYSHNGKFQYDGQWLNDIIDKPVYTPVIESGVLVSQGFKSGDKFDGWFITHELGAIKSIKFYQEGIATKGFGSFLENSNLKYKVNITASSSLTTITKFLFETLPKLNKPGYLVEFLSNGDNLALLENLAFTYDSEIGGEVEKSDYKIFSSTGLEQVNRYLKYSDNKVYIYYCGSNAYIGLVKLANTSKILNGKLYLLVQPDLAHQTTIIETPDSLTYELTGNDVTLKETGNFEFKGSGYVLEGLGEKIDGSNKYVGTFENGEIKKGIFYKSNVKIYEGSFDCKKFNGFGTEWLANGHMRYQGDYKNGKFHGQGTSYYPNAETESVEYVGSWSNDQKHGQGTLFSVSGDEIYSGAFYRDQIA